MPINIIDDIIIAIKNINYSIRKKANFDNKINESVKISEF